MRWLVGFWCDYIYIYIGNMVRVIGIHIHKRHPQTVRVFFRIVCMLLLVHTLHVYIDIYIDRVQCRCEWNVVQQKRIAWADAKRDGRNGRRKVHTLAGAVSPLTL